MEERKQKLLDYFNHMQNEDEKCLLGGMAWDNICWNIHYEVERGFTRTELGFMFPKLLGHLLMDDKNYEARKQFYESSISEYAQVIEKIKEDTWLPELVGDDEAKRQEIERFEDLIIALKVDIILLEADRKEYLEHVNKKGNETGLS